MARTRFDELHDKYHKIFTTKAGTRYDKAGTRYERLAAIVFKSINEHQVVIHDLSLKGETGVQHQIDVTIEIDGRKKRTVIECKDFDISGNKVGLDIVRNFWAVYEDTKLDEAIVITCNDFTDSARKYAKGKGIKLAILREFKESDWEGKIKVINVALDVFTTSNPTVNLTLDDDSRIDELKKDFSAVGILSPRIGKDQPIFLNLPSGKIQINDFIKQKLDEFAKTKPGPVELNVDLEGSTVEVEGRQKISVNGLILKFSVEHSAQQFRVTSSKVAELVLKGFGDSDVIVFDEDLIRYNVIPTTGKAEKV